jgi:hypothetical protein
MPLSHNPVPETVDQKIMAESLPITMASDQPAILVSGPATDAQLRATPTDNADLFAQLTAAL